MGCCHGAKPAQAAGNATTPAEAVTEAAMEMVWNWNTTGAIVVFRWWEVTNVLTLILSMLGVLVIAVLYEQFSHYVRQYDKGVAAAQSGAGDCSQDAVSGLKRKGVSWRQQAIRALLYSVQLLVSYFLMLVAMTYNGYIVFSLIVGAGIGFFFFNKEVSPSGATLRCH